MYSEAVTLICVSRIVRFQAGRRNGDRVRMHSYSAETPLFLSGLLRSLQPLEQLFGRCEMLTSLLGRFLVARWRVRFLVYPKLRQTIESLR